jgi:hypothetical protein
MELAVLPSGVYALYKLLKEFEKSQGEQVLAQNLKTQPQLYLDFLKKLNRRFVVENQSPRGDWSADKFGQFMELLNLTRFQRSILRILVTNKVIAIEDLREKIEKEYKIKIRIGSQIGGCIAGITKKADSEGIPRFIDIQKLGIGIYKYSLSFDPKLREMLSKLLEESEAEDKALLPREVERLAKLQVKAKFARKKK